MMCYLMVINWGKVGQSYLFNCSWPSVSSSISSGTRRVPLEGGAYEFPIGHSEFFYDLFQGTFCFHKCCISGSHVLNSSSKLEIYWSVYIRSQPTIHSFTRHILSHILLFILKSKEFRILLIQVIWILQESTFLEL